MNKPLQADELMNTESIMRNNYVLLDEEVVQVLEVKQNHLKIIYYREGKLKVAIVEIDRFEGIPLSEKWILKLGFKYSEGLGKYYWYIPLHDLSIDKLTFVLKEGFICFEGIKYRSLFNHITFVHQLQNLMTALKQPITFKPTE